MSWRSTHVDSQQDQADTTLPTRLTYSYKDQSTSHTGCLQETLDFAVQLLMSEAAFSLAGLRPAMGRLANAMVAALGPELQLGSPAYKLCKAIIREMQVCRSSAATGTPPLEPASQAALSRHSPC